MNLWHIYIPATLATEPALQRLSRVRLHVHVDLRLALNGDIVITDEHDVRAQRAALFAAVAAETVDGAGALGRLVGDADFDGGAVAFALERHSFRGPGQWVAVYQGFGVSGMGSEGPTKGVSESAVAGRWCSSSWYYTFGEPVDESYPRSTIPRYQAEYNYQIQTPYIRPHHQDYTQECVATDKRHHFCLFHICT